MTDNPGDSTRDLDEWAREAERARDAVHEAAIRHAQVRTMLAAELLRETVPGAAELAATIEPGHSPSVYRVLLADGTNVDEELWDDEISLVEDQLRAALDYCDPETAGWEHDGGGYMLTLSKPRDVPDTVTVTMPGPCVWVVTGATFSGRIRPLYSGRLDLSQFRVESLPRLSAFDTIGEAVLALVTHYGLTSDVIVIDGNQRYPLAAILPASGSKEIAHEEED